MRRAARPSGVTSDEPAPVGGLSIFPRFPVDVPMPKGTAIPKPKRQKRPRDLFGQLVKPPRDRNAENRRQASVVEFCRWVAPHIIIYAVPNGGKRTKTEAALFKWTGTLAGALDLVLALPNGRCAFWETKTPKGRLSDDQKDMIAKLDALGHSWAIVRTIEDARAELYRLGVDTREAK